jgi:hypothetical protein
MTQTGNPSPARIDPRRGPGGGIQWKVPEKPLSDFITKLTVTPGATGLLDPRMLIGRYGLRSELPPDPQGLLRQHDPLSGAASRQCGRNTASPATHNQDRSRQGGRAALGGTDSRNRETPTDQSHGSQERSTIHAGKLTPVFGIREHSSCCLTNSKTQIFGKYRFGKGVTNFGGVLQNIFQKHQIFPIRFQRVAVYPNQRTHQYCDRSTHHECPMAHRSQGFNG